MNSVRCITSKYLCFISDYQNLMFDIFNCCIAQEIFYLLLSNVCTMPQCGIDFTLNKISLSCHLNLYYIF